jgi:hypothetical protein
MGRTEQKKLIEIMRLEAEILRLQARIDTLRLQLLHNFKSEVIGGLDVSTGSRYD